MPQTTDLVRVLKTMPPLPQTAQQVLDLVRNPDWSIDDLVAVVRRDPTLTARILRLCNSALYSLSSEVSSVADAVAWIGTRNLVRLVMVTCAADHFGSASASAYGEPSALWRHAFATATACQWLARRCGHEPNDVAFTAGILHDVGRIVLSRFPVSVTPEHFPGDLMAWERHCFGLDHAEASGIVAESWQLPRELRRALRCHHDPEHLGGESVLPALLHLAENVVAGVDSGAGSREPIASDPVALSRLHLSAEDLLAARDHVVEELSRSAEVLNLTGAVSR